MYAATFHAFCEELEKISNVDMLKGFLATMRSKQGADRLKHVQEHLAKPEFIAAAKAHDPSGSALKKLYHMANEGARSAVAGTKIKVGSSAAHAIELAGLGILARPSIQKMRGKDMDDHSAHMHELAGLGVLAAPSAYELGKAGYQKLKSMKSKMPASMMKGAAVKKAGWDIWNPDSGKVMTSAGARAANTSTATTAAQTAAKKIGGNDLMKKLQEAKKALKAGGSGTVKISSVKKTASYSNKALSLFAR
jgi:hypothetical protein